MGPAGKPAGPCPFSDLVVHEFRVGRVVGAGRHRGDWFGNSLNRVMRALLGCAGSAPMLRRRAFRGRARISVRGRGEFAMSAGFGDTWGSCAPE
jgi:hypothetical protein